MWRFIHNFYDRYLKSNLILQAKVQEYAPNHTVIRLNSKTIYKFGLSNKYNCFTFIFVLR